MKYQTETRTDKRDPRFLIVEDDDGDGLAKDMDNRVFTIEYMAKVQSGYRKPCKLKVLVQSGCVKMGLRKNDYRPRWCPNLVVFFEKTMGYNLLNESNLAYIKARIYDGNLMQSNAMRRRYDKSRKTS